MENTADGGRVGGKSRKRKRQVSWAAAELLEEVKLFHMAKPVNPSIPPPNADDDGGLGGDGESANQPGLALLGLLGVQPTSTLSSPSPSSTSLSSLDHPARGGGGGAASVSSSLEPTNNLVSPSPLGGSRGGKWGSASLPDSDVGGFGIGADGGSGGAGDGGQGGSARLGGGSKLFKGFQKTETVVRRKKQVSPPPPPPGVPPPPLPPASGEGSATVHRYPKDIWPGHEPPSHSENANGRGSGDAVGSGSGSEESLEFFCDGCDETIPKGVERMECAVCPDEFCLCLGCYDEAEVLDKRHEHELLPSSAPCHVTRAASSSETALAVAQAVHAAQATTGEESNGVHEGYDDDDLG